MSNTLQDVLIVLMSIQVMFYYLCFHMQKLRHEVEELACDHLQVASSGFELKMYFLKG